MDPKFCNCGLGKCCAYKNTPLGGISENKRKPSKNGYCQCYPTGCPQCVQKCSCKEHQKDQQCSCCKKNNHT